MDVLVVAFYEPKCDGNVTNGLGVLKLTKKLHNCFLKLHMVNIYTNNKLFCIQIMCKYFFIELINAMCCTPIYYANMGICGFHVIDVKTKKIHDIYKKSKGIFLLQGFLLDW